MRAGEDGGKGKGESKEVMKQCAQLCALYHCFCTHSPRVCNVVTACDSDGKTGGERANVDE